MPGISQSAGLSIKQYLEHWKKMFRGLCSLVDSCPESFLLLPHLHIKQETAGVHWKDAAVLNKLKVMTDCLVHCVQLKTF